MVMSDWRPYKIKQLSELVTERDLRLLEDLERYRLLDSRLVQELHFPVGVDGHLTTSAATRAANRVVTRLEGHAFIARLSRRMGGYQHGSAATVWQLAAAGERLLRARRGDKTRRRYIEPTYGFMEHTLETARLASLIVAAARGGSFDLLSIETEPQCWRSFQGAAGTETLKPDLYLVAADDEFETHSFVEVDRGTEHLPAILRKCRIYQRYWKSGHEQASLELFPAVVWITTDERRAVQIQTAIENDRGLTTELFRSTTSSGALAQLAPSGTT
jgi:hypothetical protein